MKPLKVLVVEDDALTRDMLETVLSVRGHEVRSASNGAVGLEEIVAWRPDVLVTDLYMPAVSGK